MNGHITRRLFETLNTRFYKSSGAQVSIAHLWRDFRGCAVPLSVGGSAASAVFSAQHDRFMDVSPVSFPPLGTLLPLGVIDRT
jgi:hypothetical protein